VIGRRFIDHRCQQITLNTDSDRTQDRNYRNATYGVGRDDDDDTVSCVNTSRYCPVDKQRRQYFTICHVYRKTTAVVSSRRPALSMCYLSALEGAI